MSWAGCAWGGTGLDICGVQEGHGCQDWPPSGSRREAVGTARWRRSQLSHALPWHGQWSSSCCRARLGSGGCSGVAAMHTLNHAGPVPAPQSLALCRLQPGGMGRGALGWTSSDLSPRLCAGRSGSSGGGSGSSGRNLWVSGLSSTTRATDLKNLFSKYGKVCSWLSAPHEPQCQVCLCPQLPAHGMQKAPWHGREVLCHATLPRRPSSLPIAGAPLWGNEAQRHVQCAPCLWKSRDQEWASEWRTRGIGLCSFLWVIRSEAWPSRGCAGAGGDSMPRPGAREQTGKIPPGVGSSSSCPCWSLLPDTASPHEGLRWRLV